MALLDVKFILMDIEGTTSDIHFVKNVLFPYSAKQMRNFISRHKTNPRVLKCLHDTGATDHEAAICQLLQWIDEDVKHPALKSIQGMIWEEGFKNQEFKSHIYPDVLPAWQKWREAKIAMGIYSSGSVQAQKLFFAHTTEGNLLSYLTAHFDLEVGGKREVKSYEKIASKLELSPREILFLSDIPEELLAARTAGYKVAHIVREGTAPSADFAPYRDFAAL